MSSSPKYEPHFYGPVQGVVIGDNNTVTLIFQSGKKLIVPFLAPPPPPYELVGRDNILDDLKQRLFAGGSLALSALNGLPGVGKTALAVALAHDREVLDHFRDGVLWAGLGREGDAFALLGTWAVALGISSDEIAKLTSLEERAKAIRYQIGMRHMLLVVDDAWQSETALAFKVGGPNCAHLVTTRLPEVAVHFAGEGVNIVRELSEVDSLTLLARLAPGVTEIESDAARELVHAVSGLPLGLILMGNYLRVQALSGQPRRIGAALERLRQVEERLQVSQPQSPLESHPSLAPGASMSLQAIIAISDRALDKASRRALYALSVFPPKPNTFSEEASLAVAAEPAKILDTLTDYGLLEPGGPGRYTLHQTIADYARLKLANGTPYEWMAEFFKDYTQAHQNDYGMIETEQNNIIAALQWAIDSEHIQIATDIIISFFEFLEGRGLYDLACSMTQSVVERARDADVLNGLPLLLRNIGRIQRNRGHATASRMTFLEALAIAENLDDKESQATLNMSVGTSYVDAGKYELAERYYRQGLMLARETGDIEGISSLLQNLGVVAGNRGAYDQAEAYFQESLTLAREIGHRERISALLPNLGAVAEERGAYNQAGAYYQEGLALAREIGHRERISRSLTGLGVVAANRGEYEQAEAHFQEGLKVAREIGHSQKISYLLGNLGKVATNRGVYGQAETYLKEGLALAREIGHRERISALLRDLSTLAVKRKTYDQAEAYLQEGLTLAREAGLRDIVGHLLQDLGTVAVYHGAYNQAEAYFQESLALARELGHQWLTSRVLVEWGRFCLKRHNWGLAEKAFREALKIAHEVGIRELVAEALHGLAQVTFAHGNIAEAQQQGQESLTLFEEIGHVDAGEVKGWLDGLPAVDSSE